MSHSISLQLAKLIILEDMNDPIRFGKTLQRIKLANNMMVGQLADWLGMSHDETLQLLLRATEHEASN